MQESASEIGNVKRAHLPLGKVTATAKFEGPEHRVKTLNFADNNS